MQYTKPPSDDPKKANNGVGKETGKTNSPMVTKSIVPQSTCTNKPIASISSNFIFFDSFYIHQKNMPSRISRIASTTKDNMGCFLPNFFDESFSILS